MVAERFVQRAARSSPGPLRIVSGSKRKRSGRHRPQMMLKRMRTKRKKKRIRKKGEGGGPRLREPTRKGKSGGLDEEGPVAGNEEGNSLWQLEITISLSLAAGSVVRRAGTNDRVVIPAPLD